MNPHFPGAPCRMMDGRLFTDYRPSCEMMPPVPEGSYGTYYRNQNMQKHGIHQIEAERTIASMKAQVRGCVDTMVPELTKRICTANGCQTLEAFPVGLGQGRIHLSARPDLARTDPDITALTVTPPLAQTYSSPIIAGPVRQKLAMVNHYSAPFG